MAPALVSTALSSQDGTEAAEAPSVAQAAGSQAPDEAPAGED